MENFGTSEIGDSKSATPWGWSFATWKLSAFLIHVFTQNNRTHSHYMKKNKCFCFKYIMWLIIMKMSVKNRSHRWGKNRRKHGHKYKKRRNCLSMVMLTCIKQHLSNIWRSIHEKVKQHWGWVEIKHCLKKVCAGNIFGSLNMKNLR